ncbi:helix-turn-helix domain-containing protein [Paenibacillus sp. 2RAB27]|uniref:helix-turn-helix domain-containing protein n=1 Tax=Paenibacillus sp. 2RAB27 TaxID=3232991 RepID=UPI003F94CBA1
MASLAKLIGERVRTIRKIKKLTQEQLGELAELQSSYIGGLERGERNVSLETVEKIIRALNMSQSEFFQFNEIGNSGKMAKSEFLEVFTSELQTRNLEDLRKFYEIYKLIYK